MKHEGLVLFYGNPHNHSDWFVVVFFKQNCSLHYYYIWLLISWVTILEIQHYRY